MPAKPKLIERLREVLLRLPNFIGKEIWHHTSLEEQGFKASLFAMLRIVAITIEGILKNRIPSQAAALSYYTLIALGPLLAIVIMVSGFVIKEDDPDVPGSQETLIVSAITDLVYFIAPSAEEASKSELGNFFDELDRGSTLLASPDEETREDRQVNPQIVNFIQDLVRNARSGTMGVIGTLILIAISIQLLASIEKTFNTIWGVRHARDLAQQVVFYWTFISLGAVLGFTALTLGTVSKVAAVFEQLPFGALFRDGFLALSPLFAFGLVVLLLAVFNRFIPNTRVRWVPAMLGASIVALLLYLNQALSFLYIGFVIRQQSLFGAVGILPILLFGLFIFWLVLLLGGQLTYAIQNVNNLTNQRAWENISHRTREILSLATLLIISRRFQARKAACTAEELANEIRVPGNILNETLARLSDLGYIVPVEPRDPRDDLGPRYQPAVPLDSISLAEFKDGLESFGNNDGTDLILASDPLITHYREHLLAYERDPDARLPLSQLLKSAGTSTPAKPTPADSPQPEGK